MNGQTDRQTSPLRTVKQPLALDAARA